MSIIFSTFKQNATFLKFSNPEFKLFSKFPQRFSDSAAPWETFDIYYKPVHEDIVKN